MEVDREVKEAIKQLPKVELHVHLDGSVQPNTLIQLAKAQGKSLPVYEEQALLTYMQVEEQCESLNEYLKTFDFVLPFLQTSEALETVAYELVAQCAEHEVKYVEVRFAPHLHTNEGLSIAEIYEAVIRGLQRGEQQFNIVARCIGIILRGHDEQKQIETVELAAQYLGKGLVAVDLAGAEALYPPELYIEAFNRAKALNIPITIHAGEAGGAHHIHTSVHRLNANRIGHGVRLKEDIEIFNDINKLQIPLELCPISNIQTKAVQSWEQYPLKDYLEQGINVTVNSDNLTVSNTNLTKELTYLVEKLDITFSQLVKLQLNAINSIFLEKEKRNNVQQTFKQQLEWWVSTYCR